jgi:hypothetical protein
LEEKVAAAGPSRSATRSQTPEESKVTLLEKKGTLTNQQQKNGTPGTATDVNYNLSGKIFP